MPRNILILEDDQLFSRVLIGRIRGLYSTANIVAFQCIEDTRLFLENYHLDLDLVLLDHYLPDGYGLSLLKDGWFQDIAVLVISSDDAPEMPGNCVSAGAAYFLNKNELSSELFLPLVRGLVERNRFQRELAKTRSREAVLEAARALVHNLKHEINNPLGAVLGAAYLMKGFDVTSEKYQEAAKLVEMSSMRIKKVMDELYQTIETSAFLEKPEVQTENSSTVAAKNLTLSSEFLKGAPSETNDLTFNSRSMSRSASNSAN
jgi:response regulator of citrate/malate metabolism